MKVVGRNLLVKAVILIVSVVLLGCVRSETPFQSTSTVQNANRGFSNERGSGAEGVATQPVSAPPGPIYPSLVAGDNSPAQTGPPGILQVLIETDKQAYRTNEEMVVTVINGLDSSITTFDQQAFCSIIKLEQQTESEWEEVRNCLAGVPSSFVTLEPHSETVVRLPGLSAGAYRVSIAFSPGEVFSFSNSLVVPSLPFDVLDDTALN